MLVTGVQVGAVVQLVEQNLVVQVELSKDVGRSSRLPGGEQGAGALVAGDNRAGVSDDNRLEHPQG